MTDIAGRLRRAEPAGDEQVAYARALCRRHAAPLFVMASLLLDEGDTAGDIVAAVGLDLRDGPQSPPRDLP